MKEDLFQKFEDIPCFSKADLRLIFSGKEEALNERIKRALKNKTIFQLKKGLYVARLFWLKEPDKTSFLEFVASKICYPSYLSLEYVLAKNNLLTEGTYPLTSITTKSSRVFQNFLGSFRYSSIKEKLFTGFEKRNYASNSYFVATPAGALFDWFYLKKNIRDNLREEVLEDLRVNWENFSQADFQEFKKFIKLSGSKKMTKIAKILEKDIYVDK